jgi:RNA polymerase sigma-70 factor (ECF subfamily)
MDELTRLAYASRTGDRAARGEFIEATYPDIWRLCAHLVDRQAADDLAQAVAERVLDALHHFRGEASARVWVLAIARRTCMDELRLRARQTRRSESLRVAAEHRAEQAPEAGYEARDLLSHLEPDRRAAFVLTQVFGLSYQEAAHTCDCPVGTIRSRVARARSDLVELIEQSAPRSARSL